jgi:hypothetical protein
MRSIPLPDPPLTDGEVRLRPWERGDVPAIAAGGELALAIVDADDGVLGAVGLANFDRGDLTAEIGLLAEDLDPCSLPRP